jgi:hypothetical protein
MPDSPTSEAGPAFLCHCKSEATDFDRNLMRSACVGERVDKEHEGKRYCVLHYPDKEKSAAFEKAFQKKLGNEDFNFNGVWFPDVPSFSEFDFSKDVNFGGATFSAYANFARATFSANADFSGATFSANADFGGSTFNEKAMAYFARATFSAAADFLSATFSAAADFSSATFSAEVRFINATFRAGADFSFATFSEGAKADFQSATFRAEADTFLPTANFYSATFRAAADFRFATFSKWAKADFRSVTFGAEADFRSATFSTAANFNEATFADYVRFAGSKAQPIFTDTSQLDLQFARVKTPDRVSFHTANLRPHWFVNVDAREFNFTNVEWDWRTIEEEIKSLQSKSVSSPHSLLDIACRNLAVNAEDNNLYEEASRFRFMAMDVRRLEKWRGFVPWRLSWWYYQASGYGERVLKASLVLLGIWFVAGLLYTRVGFARWEPKLVSESDIVAAKQDDVGVPLPFKRALTYSVGVMTLQKPEPRPATTAAQTVVLLETILGPVQAALLALAIRRKFMR